MSGIGSPEPMVRRDGLISVLARTLFLVFAGATIVASPWMLGSASISAQKTLLLGALCTLVAGALVRATTISTPGAKVAWRQQRLALAAGFLFLGLLYWQAINPSYEVVITGLSWHFRQLGPPNAMPSSLVAPFDVLPTDFLPFKNAWRYLLIFSVAWIYAAGLALGLVKREDAKYWTAIVGVNGAALAVVCIVHRAMGAELTLWKYRDTVAFTGSPVFFYKNHNGAYMAASLAVVLGLATGTGILRRVWQAVALVVWVATLSLNSRVATGCATLWMLVYATRLWSPTCVEPMVKEVKQPIRLLWLVLSVLAVIALIELTNGGKMLARFADGAQVPGDFMQGGHYRVLLRRLGCAMWLDRPAFGWGGGAYLYLFNDYLVRVPELLEEIYRGQPALNRLYMVSADCDWVEFLVEYGAVGVGLLIFTLAILIQGSWSLKAWRKGMPVFVTLGGVGIALHAWYDHVLRNQALIVLFLGLLMVGARLSAKPESMSRVRSLS